MEKSSLSGMKTMPSVPKAAVPRVIGTELHFIEGGKIFVGLIRECKENEIIIQTGHSNIRPIKYSQIIAITPCKQFKNEFKTEISVFIRKEENRTEVDCNSQTAENVNGVMFYSIAKNKEEKDWSPYENYWSVEGVLI